MSIQNLHLVLGQSTFGSNDSLKSSWELSYKLGTPFLLEGSPILAESPKLNQPGWEALVLPSGHSTI